MSGEGCGTPSKKVGKWETIHENFFFLLRNNHTRVFPGLPVIYIIMDSGNIENLLQVLLLYHSRR